MMLCDGGANVECKPIHLLQNAIMSSAFLRRAYAVENPTVGLLNVGTEKDKGHTLAKEAHELLSRSSLAFTGNVEGGDIFQATDSSATSSSKRQRVFPNPFSSCFLPRWERSSLSPVSISAR